MPAKYIPRVTVACDRCGKQIQREQYELRRSTRFFCSYDCAHAAGRETAKERYPHSPGFKGGEYIDKGYRIVLAPNHPNANDEGYVREHRLVMSEVMGRPLRSDEHVHHIDGNKANNTPNNLQVLTCSEHMKLHRGYPNGACRECGTTERRHRAQGLCTRCYGRQWSAKRKAS